MAQIFTGHCGKLTLLLVVDGRFGRLYVASGPGLDFNKTEDVFVPANEVDLPSTMGRAKVTGNDDVAQFAQIEVGIFLAAASGKLMGRRLVGREHATGKRVEGAYGRMS